MLLDLAITVGVEAVKELLDLGVLGGLVAASGKTVSSESSDFSSVDLTVAVDVELAEGFLSLSESGLSGLGNLFLIGLIKCHSWFLLSLIYLYNSKLKRDA